MRRPAVLALAALFGAACDAPFEFQAQVAAIHISPDTVSLAAGDSVQLSAQVTDSSGHAVSVAVFWSSSVDSAATVSSTGMVRSLTPGVVTITAGAGDIEGRASIAISPRVAGIAIDQGPVITVPGATVAFTTHSIDPHGYAFVSPLIMFSSTDTAVFSVSSAGVVSARASGLAFLRASFGAVQDSTSIRVVTASFVSLSAGDASHTCGVTMDSLALCWGANDVGQLSVPSLSRSPAPVTAPYGLSFTAVHAGATFTCGEGPTPYCWGSNFRSRLGVGDTPAASVKPLPVYGGGDLRDLSTGWNDACGLERGVVYCWGENPGAGGVVPVAQTPTAVTLDSVLTVLDVSDGFTCGLTAGGTAYCWGINQFGQLGDSNPNGEAGPGLVSGGHTFIGIGGGSAHACGLTAAGQAWCWGLNSSGQLGTGDTSSSSVPRAVVTGLTFQALDAGGTQTCGIAADSSAYCWGAGRAGPILVGGGLHFRTLTVGGDGHICGLATDGRAYCWGANDRGQLGDGTYADRSSPTLVLGQP